LGSPAARGGRPGVGQDGLSRVLAIERRSAGAENDDCGTYLLRVLLQWQPNTKIRGIVRGGHEHWVVEKMPRHAAGLEQSRRELQSEPGACGRCLQGPPVCPWRVRDAHERRPLTPTTGRRGRGPGRARAENHDAGCRQLCHEVNSRVCPRGRAGPVFA